MNFNMSSTVTTYTCKCILFVYKFQLVEFGLTYRINKKPFTILRSVLMLLHLTDKVFTGFFFY